MDHTSLLDPSPNSVTLFTTGDGGQTWNVRPMPDEIGREFVAHGVAATSPMHGWIVGASSLRSPQPSGGKFWATDDGGVNWYLSWSGLWNGYGLRDTTARSAHAAWAVGDFGTVLVYAPRTPAPTGPVTSRAAVVPTAGRTPTRTPPPDDQRTATATATPAPGA